MYVFTLLRNSLFLAAEKYPWARHRSWTPVLIMIGTILYAVHTNMMIWWHWLPVFGRAIGTSAYAAMNPVRMKTMQLAAMPFWLLFWGLSGLWPALVSDLAKTIIMAASIPRTRTLHLEKQAERLALEST